jgi:hypothetical protein
VHRLRGRALLGLVQHLQPRPLSSAQLDPRLFPGASRPPEEGTFLHCTNRTFSFCRDKHQVRCCSPCASLIGLRKFWIRRFRAQG